MRDVEATIERAPDGHPLPYHPATEGPGRCPPSGPSPRAIATIRGEFRSRVRIGDGEEFDGQLWRDGDDLVVGDVAGEEVALVGNNKVWEESGLGQGEPDPGQPVRHEA